MLSIRFSLKEPSSKEPTLIYALISHGVGKRIKISTGIKVAPADWNKNTMRLRERATLRNAKATNYNLTQIVHAIEKVYTSVHLNNLSTADLKEQIVYAIKNNGDAKASESQNLNLVSYMRKLNQEKQNLKSSTRKTTITDINLLDAYLKGGDIAMDNIDYEWYNKLIEYLNRRKLSKNYIGKVVKTIKSTLNDAHKKGLITNNTYVHFERPKEEIDNIYLSLAELERIKNVELSGYLDKARDLFIIGCYTALRFSDFSTITSDDIIDNKINLTTTKTGEKVIIPIHPEIRGIMQKYSDGFPGTISNQKLNDYIKEVCKRAEINEKVSKTRTEGGKRVTRYYEKWELVSTHTARRSGATNMYKAGVPTLAIMKITGHRTERSFLTYIKISKEENADMLAAHPFFAG